MLRLSLRRWRGLPLKIIFFAFVISTIGEAAPVDITVKYFGEAGGYDVGGKAAKAVQEEFYSEHPDIRLKAWSALRLPGNMWQQADLLAVAGGTAADVQPLFLPSSPILRPSRDSGSFERSC